MRYSDCLWKRLRGLPDEKSMCVCTGRQVTSNTSVFEWPSERELTIKGDLSEIILVLGLSLSKCSLKCGANSVDHASNSSCKAAIFRNDSSYEAAVG